MEEKWGDLRKKSRRKAEEKIAYNDLSFFYKKIEKQKKDKEMSTIKFLWRLIRGKIDLGDEGHAKAIAILVSTIIDTMAIILSLFSLLLLGGIVYVAITSPWTKDLVFNNIVTCVVSISVALFGLVVSLILRITAIGIEKEKDKNYVMALFSGLTGFIALIISLIALFK